MLKTNNMEKLKQDYRTLTGKEPGQLYLLAEGASKKLVDSLANPLTGRNYAASQNEIEFIDVYRTKSGFNVKKITDLHRQSKGHYSGITILLGSLCPVEIQQALANLPENRHITIVSYGKTPQEIDVNRKKLFPEDDELKQKIRDGFFETLDSLCVTDGFLSKRPNLICFSDSSTIHSAAVSFPVKSNIHIRPSAIFCKRALRYDCGVYVKKDNNVTSGKSMMGILSLGANINSTLVCAANGTDAHDCLQDLSTFVQSPEFIASN